jgi:hypothetical protein
MSKIATEKQIQAAVLAYLYDHPEGATVDDLYRENTDLPLVTVLEFLWVVLTKQEKRGTIVINDDRCFLSARTRKQLDKELPSAQMRRSAIHGTRPSN